MTIVFMMMVYDVVNETHKMLVACVEATLTMADPVGRTLSGNREGWSQLTTRERAQTSNFIKMMMKI
jgi:hypothetical protein